jgi:hypothetical protein
VELKLRRNRTTGGALSPFQSKVRCYFVDQPEKVIAMHANPLAVLPQRTPRFGIGRRAALAGAAAFVCAATLAPHKDVWAQAPASAPASGAVTLFENVRIFDGKGAALSAPSNVLIRGNIIERISTQPIPVDRRADTRIIAGGGRTLMPGLIDNHWHAALIRVTPAEAFGDVTYNSLLAGAEATDTLMRGFTTVRDLGGPVFGLKRAIDACFLSVPLI